MRFFHLFLLLPDLLPFAPATCFCCHLLLLPFAFAATCFCCHLLLLPFAPVACFCCHLLLLPLASAATCFCCHSHLPHVLHMHHLIFITSVRYANVGTDYLTVSAPLLPYCFRLPLLPYCFRSTVALPFP
ncbi:hypothetical protein MmiAt1_06120 [Methanimicrococcus sp. At1]|uniref:Uncharacterized protein n=1 Tax=Methanimicrococcus hacksteinii TaxID=3028293 RepID=A0ABU3VNT4_9EURY|nr:hypothetical protein [Methanimicrococcus sp. At1]